MRERERDWTGEREREMDRRESSGGLLPPLLTHSAPLWGRSAWPPARPRPVAALGGAGHRQGGVAPATPKREGEKEGGDAQGAQVGPLVAHGRRHAAGGAQIRGGAGHPKEKGGNRRGFRLVMEKSCVGGDGDFGGDGRIEGDERRRRSMVLWVVFGWRRWWWWWLI